jgi:hypothetical protein
VYIGYADNTAVFLARQRKDVVVTEADDVSVTLSGFIFRKSDPRIHMLNGIIVVSDVQVDAIFNRYFLPLNTIAASDTSTKITMKLVNIIGPLLLLAIGLIAAIGCAIGEICFFIYHFGI